MQVRERRSCLLCRSRPCLVSPTGTPAIEIKRGPKVARSRRLRSSSSPSLTPGQSTSWAWKSIPARSSRARSSMMSAPFGVADQRDAQLRVGGVHGDVQRRDALLLDPPPVLFGQVGQGDEAAVEHRVAVVVVHDVERAAHPLGDLLDEAERAGVLADPDPVEGRIGEGDAPELVALEVQIDPPDRPGPFDLEAYPLGLGVELEVERVLDRLGVDRGRPGPRFEDPEFVGERARRDRLDEARRLRREIDAPVGQRANDGHRLNTWVGGANRIGTGGECAATGRVYHVMCGRLVFRASDRPARSSPPSAPC